MRKIYVIYVLLILLSFPFFAFPQAQNKRDSLLYLIENEGQDTSKVLLYGNLARYYLKSNNDSAQFYATTGLYLAEKVEYGFGIGSMYHILGHSKVVNDSLETAKEFYQNALLHFKKANKIASMASVYLAIGNVFYVQNNFPEALNLYILGEKIADNLNLVDLLPHFYNNLAGIYFQLEDYHLTLEYFKNALKISELNGDTETSINILNNMARAYYKSNDFEQANKYIERALKLTENVTPNEGFKVHIYQAKGEIEIELKNYQSALNIYKNILDIINKMGPGYLGPIAIDKADCQTNIGKCFFELGNFTQAMENLNLGYKLAEELGLVGIQRDASFYLSAIYDSLGNDKKAFSYFKIYKTLYDSISNENTSKKITQLKMQFEFDKKTKEQELEQARKEVLQKRKELLLYLIIAGVLSGLIIFLLLYFLQKSKIKRVHLERKNLELDLDSRNKELTTNVMYLLKKNEFIESISDKLKKSKQYFKQENRSFVDNIIKELEASLSQDSWEEFELRFQQVHKDFYKKLNDQFPDLTPNEQKLCAFLRLNMSTKGNFCHHLSIS